MFEHTVRRNARTRQGQRREKSRAHVLNKSDSAGQPRSAPAGVGREARSPQNPGKLGRFRQDTFPDCEATAGAAATLSGRGDGPIRFPAENRLATAVRARTVRAERPGKVFQRVTVNIGKTDLRSFYQDLELSCG